MTSGCAAVLSIGDARTVPRGAIQVGLDPAMIATRSSTPVIPAGDLVVRVGLGSRVDLGARAGFSGFGGDLRVQMLGTRFSEVGLLAHATVALRAVNGGDYFPTGAGFNAGLALGVPLNDFLRLGVGGQFSGHSLGNYGAGGTASLIFRVSRNFAFGPEAGVLVPIAGRAPIAARGGIDVLFTFGDEEG